MAKSGIGSKRERPPASDCLTTSSSLSHLSFGIFKLIIKPSVEVTLDEPDENIILGLETKVKIDSASLENVLIIPLDALCEDEEGEYVYILSDDQADKCFVETGVRNDNDVQIVSGIYEGDIVIWNDEVELSDGMEVKAVK